MRIAKEVRHGFLMLPYYSLFDDLEYTGAGPHRHPKRQS